MRFRPFSLRRAQTVGICLAGLLLAPLQVWAQGGVRPERPNRALFGGGYGDTEHSLIATAQLGAGTGVTGGDGQEATDPEGEPSLTTPASSSFANWNGALVYSVSRRRFSLETGISRSSSYFPTEAEFEGSGVRSATGVNANLQAQVRTRTSIHAGYAMSREPLSVLSLLPRLDGGAASPLLPLDYYIGGGASVDYVRQSATLDVTHNVSRRASLSLGYSAHQARLGEEQGRWRGGFAGSLSYGISRGVALRAGYGLEEFVVADRPTELPVFPIDGPEGEPVETSATAPEPTLRRVRGQWLDLGIDFSRELSVSRRTRLSLNTGSKMMGDLDRRRFEVVGSAALTREIGRSWSTALGYERNVGFVDALDRVAFTEGLTGSLSGLFGRRVSLAADTGVSRGHVGSASEQNTYMAYRAGGGLTIGLARTIGMGIHYSYYRYRFDELVAPEAFPATALSRQTVRVSFDLLAPIFVRARRP
jgi:hypothetical protein